MSKSIDELIQSVANKIGAISPFTSDADDVELARRALRAIEEAGFVLIRKADGTEVNVFGEGEG